MSRSKGVGEGGWGIIPNFSCVPRTHSTHEDSYKYPTPTTTQT